MEEWHTKVSSLTWRERVIGSRVSLYLHQRSERGTDETESGLLPTVRASDANHGGPNQRDSKGHPGLCGMLALIPTPLESDGDSAGSPKAHHLMLNSVIGMIPTPTSRDYRSEKCSLETYQGNSRPLSETLGTNTGMRLHSDFVSWMMGYLIDWLDV